MRGICWAARSKARKQQLFLEKKLRKKTFVMLAPGCSGACGFAQPVH
jgi:hypothetical protein